MRLDLTYVILRVDDGRLDLPNLVVETKSFRGEDLEVKATMVHAYWVPSVNILERQGCWASAEFTVFYDIKLWFEAVIAAAREGA